MVLKYAKRGSIANEGGDYHGVGARNSNKNHLRPLCALRQLHMSGSRHVQPIFTLSNVLLIERGRIKHLC